MNRIDGVTYEQASDGCERVVVVDGPHRLFLHYIGLDALIRNKQASGRPKDLDDLRYLKKAQSKRRTT